MARSDSSVTVNYANLTYSFIKFQEQYKNLCQIISEEKKANIIQSFKRLNSYIYEHLTFVDSQDFRDYLITYLNKLRDEIYEDTNYFQISKLSNRSTSEQISFNQKYFYYLIKIFKIIGYFGDELTKTFMPNKTDRQKLFKFWNNDFFFEQFTYYKSNCSMAISEFELVKFKKGFSYFLGFYFAYYLFIDAKSRKVCENVFTNILNIYINRNVQNLIINKNQLRGTKLELLKDIDSSIHNAINSIFFRCNYSYSNYGVLPRMSQKKLIDETSI